MNPIDRIVFSTDWITLALFFSMVFLALGKHLFQSRFLSFMILPFNNKYVILHNKKGELFNGFHLFLTLFQIINLSLFIFLCQKNFAGAPLGENSFAFFTIMGGVLLFEILKLGLQHLKGFIFNTQELISRLVFYKTSYLNYSSGILFFGNVILTYITNSSIIAIYLIIALIIFINGIGLLRLLKDYQNTLLPHLLYFILYLCTFDIAPLLLLGSYVKD